MLVRRMVEDLDVPMAVRVCPIVREPDGLAMSSRNAYLSPEDRKRAVALSAALRSAEESIAQGERGSAAIAARIRGVIEAVAPERIDYIAVVHPETLLPVETVEGAAVVLVAVVIGGTRLIDNCTVQAPKPPARSTSP
jgi:pantoate--beta-alanine ligase